MEVRSEFDKFGRALGCQATHRGLPHPPPSLGTAGFPRASPAGVLYPCQPCRTCPLVPIQSTMPCGKSRYNQNEGFIHG